MTVTAGVNGLGILGKTQTLWEKVNSLGGVGTYDDENWCEEYEPDTYLLWVLTWGRWHESRQNQVWSNVRKVYLALDEAHHRVKRLNTLSSQELKQLADEYPYKWQKAFLEAIVSYLRQHETTLNDLVKRFKESGPGLSLAEMEIALGTNSTKIASCFLRDCVRADVFPIDSRVEEVLDHYGLPIDSWAIMEACERLKIPTRIFARAAYDRSAELLK